MVKSPLLFCTLLFAAACSGGDDSSAGTADAAGKVDSCPQKPTRIIVLGDSIAACLGNKDAATCGPKIFHTSLAAGYAPGLAYENLAVSGDVTTDVVDRQLATVTKGTAGHVMVLIYVGGNDLQKYLQLSDGAAQGGYDTDLPGIIDDWNSIFAFFNDTANFPDGATIVMNNQYNPFDDCSASPYGFITAAKNSILDSFNTELTTLADGQDNAYITDQHGPYLGHGNHVNTASCPHYQAGLEPFMGDLIHPNAAGHANLAAQWDSIADSLYSDCQ